MLGTVAAAVGTHSVLELMPAHIDQKTLEMMKSDIVAGVAGKTTVLPTVAAVDSDQAWIGFFERTIQSKKLVAAAVRTLVRGKLESIEAGMFDLDQVDAVAVVVPVGTAVIVAHRNLVVEPLAESVVLAVDIVVIVERRNLVVEPLAEIVALTVDIVVIAAHKNLVAKSLAEPAVLAVDIVIVARRILVAQRMSEAVLLAADIVASVVRMNPAVAVALLAEPVQLTADTAVICVRRNLLVQPLVAPVLLVAELVVIVAHRNLVGEPLSEQVALTVGWSEPILSASRTGSSLPAVLDAALVSVPVAGLVVAHVVGSAALVVALVAESPAHHREDAMGSQAFAEGGLAVMGSQSSFLGSPELLEEQELRVQMWCERQREDHPWPSFSSQNQGRVPATEPWLVA